MFEVGDWGEEEAPPPPRTVADADLEALLQRVELSPAEAVAAAPARAKPPPARAHPRFPSKVGGAPVWLHPQPPGALACARCGRGLRLLVQLYCPRPGMPHAFHCSLLLFCCGGDCLETPAGWRALRCGWLEEWDWSEVAAAEAAAERYRARHAADAGAAPDDALSEAELGEGEGEDEGEDDALAAFQRRVSAWPEQVLRYCHHADAQPLWLSRLRRPAEVPPCGRCGAPRWFEYQIVPNLDPVIVALVLGNSAACTAAALASAGCALSSNCPAAWWRLLYWATLLCGWLLPEVLSVALLAGQFSALGRCRAALRSRLFFYATLLGAAACALLFLQLPGAGAGLLSAVAGGGGLLLLALLLGQGMVALPRALWTLAPSDEWRRSLAYGLAVVDAEHRARARALEDCLQHVDAVLWGAASCGLTGISAQPSLCEERPALLRALLLVHAALCTAFALARSRMLTHLPLRFPRPDGRALLQTTAWSLRLAAPLVLHVLHNSSRGGAERDPLGGGGSHYYHGLCALLTLAAAAVTARGCFLPLRLLPCARAEQHAYPGRSRSRQAAWAADSLNGLKRLNGAGELPRSMVPEELPYGSCQCTRLTDVSSEGRVFVPNNGSVGENGAERSDACRRGRFS
ncbi:putative programmed cell death protein [Emiliania huxleyi CCMP1516]|uniref:Programmed cell death protein 2 C-terminal domain-containing protein n=2 Tax=Emiliania huxleyi TaxID=2903 RepID=A0A0D3INL7_EMIH1|nr:putative programmed cell death protein [Emiliania huxleyi CCMP1516]EOD12852.1 putative programmed cell death protein [Emiliania huxleyi CCMP1516]|eukprot:XP_005765281.1 putative programmed cell death protein [Emiliania huxleyi CCMP1516]